MVSPLRSAAKQLLPAPILEARKQHILRRQQASYGPVPGQGEKGDRAVFFHHAFKALRFNGIDGDYLEFGCHGGMTFGLAHNESRRHGHQCHLWAFDSFEGLPETEEVKDEHPFWRAGTLATSLDRFHAVCAQQGIAAADYETVRGFYDQSLPPMQDSEPKNVAMAYIDCDLYSSTMDVLKFLQPRLKHGMILAFDDYFCWSSTQPSGERRAMLEFFAQHSRWSLLPYLSFGWHGQSFVLEDQSLYA